MGGILNEGSQAKERSPHSCEISTPGDALTVVRFPPLEIFTPGDEPFEHDLSDPR